MLTRPQMFTGNGHREEQEQRIVVGARRDGRLLAIDHEKLSVTSPFDDWAEPATGVSSQLYACESFRGAHRLVRGNTMTPTFTRGPGEALGVSMLEIAMDELAHQLGIDPVELRLRNLSHPRFRRVLERAADAFGWQAGAQPTQRGQGVAIGLDVGSYCATCVQLEVQGREVRIDRVTATLDCGLVVNPDGARNQMEGAIVMGMGTALYEAIDFQAGRVLNAGFTRYRVPRAGDAPRIETLLVGDDGTPSTGAGEPGIVPIAAAIANAVFDRTGDRHRELPVQRYLA
jgi:CO/xanthine dehydrogenase Mo-binding subunit